MDKKKSRTDLLAAGRQKLQQFRQKKDNKGTDQKKDNKGSSSRGKSSKKSGKFEQLEHNPDMSSSGVEILVPPQVAEGEISSHVESDLGTLDSLVTSTDNESAHESDVSATLPSSEPQMDEQGNAELVFGHAAEARQLEAVALEKDIGSSFPSGGESSRSIGIEGVGAVASSTSEFTDTENAFKDADMPVVVDAFGSPASGDIRMGARVETERESGNGKKVQDWSQPEDIPDVSLIHARGDQEANGLTFEPSAKSLEKMDLDKAAAEAKQTGNAGYVSVSSSSVSYVSAGVPTSLPSHNSGVNPKILSQSEGVNPKILSQQRVDIADSSTDRISETSSGMGFYGDNIKERFSAEPEDINVSGMSSGKHLPQNISSHEEPHDITSLEEPHNIASREEHHDIMSHEDSHETVRHKDPHDVTSQEEPHDIISHEERHDIMSHKEPHDIMSHEEPHDIVSHEEPYETDPLNASVEAAVIHICDGCSVSFSQLIDIVKGLGEDEYEFLCRSREPASLETSLVERMKEELYVANSMKDMLQLQLREQSDLQNEFDHHHHQLQSELFHLHASFSAGQEKNNLLAEELDDCRSKLDAVTSLKEKLENKLLAAEAQAEEYSARGDELQLNLERSQQDITSISMELSKATGLLTNLQVEKETLDVIISSATDDKKKLVEEKESRDRETEKLLSELAGCKNVVATLQAEIDKLDGTIGPLTDEKLKLFEEKELLLRETEKLRTELTECKTLVVVQEVENSNLSETISQLTKEQKKLEEDNSYLSHEIEKAYLEGDANKILLTALQSEYACLRKGHSLLANEREKLQEEMVQSVTENNRLSTELLVLKERLSTEHVEHTRLSVDLEGAMTRLDKLTEENVFLSSSLEVHKAKMREIVNREAQASMGVEMPVKHGDSSAVLVSGQENETVLGRDYQITKKYDVEVSHPVEEIFDVSSEFSVMKEHLEKGENMLQKLERAIEQIHMYSASLSKSSGKAEAPGVSKLIQAFESKLQDDGHELEGMPSTRDQSEADPFISVKGQMRNFRAMLEQLVLDARSASILFKGVCDDRIAVNEKFRELNFQFESLKEHSDILEADHVELKILCEAAKQHIYGVEAKNSELDVHCESLKQQENRLRVENMELNEKLDLYLSGIDSIEKQLYSLQKSSDHTASSIQVQLEGLQEESERVLKLEEELTSSIFQIDETIGRLDEYLLRFYSSLSSGSHDGLDINNRIVTSVDISIKVIEDLEKKLEAACAKHETASNSYEELNERFNNLLEKNELVTRILHMVYTELTNLMIDSLGSVDSSGADMESLQLMDLFNFDSYKNLMERAKNFLSERLELQSINEHLHLELSTKIKDIEELNGRCLDSSSFRKLAEKLEGVLNLENSENSFNEAPASYLESVVSVLVQNCKEIDEQASLFRKELESKELELIGSQERMLQCKTECDLLRQSLNQAEEFLLAARSELLEKSKELEQSEQRLSSIREKLSIAVAKGKGLVVQRDNLKQSLAETSSELGRCSEELKLKDSQLQEVEAKLKTYAEAGERVEALESELSYIRNSATALRESFLLKDSLLQRIEEILEDLDLPDYFHSRDILEKVEWLARNAMGNSLQLSDWDQKASGSHSDAGFVVTEPWREDVQPGSNSDDLRIKFEELQGKFYGLAEQNEMLERSLMERNDLVKRWEALLGSINMPSQLRSMEVEDKIEWLGNELSESIHYRDSLQQKIDNLENYCRSLTTDLEASQNQISDVEDNFQSVVQERAHLSERLETLNFDHEKLSARTAQFELENERLQNEVKDLHETLVEKLGNEERLKSIEGEMMRLKDLIFDVMQEEGLHDLALTGGESLEGLLGKLIDYYKTSVKPVVVHEADGNFSEVPLTNPDSLRSRESLVSEGTPIDEHQAEVVIANPDEATSRDISVLETPDIASLKKDLDEALHELSLTRDERGICLEKQQSLVTEFNALDKKRMELQELLNLEEQKSASAREKLIVAVRKGKSLVQQRDSLNQTIQEMTAELARLKSESSDRENTLSEYEQKIKELAPNRGKVEALESECLLLRNHLQETEHLLQERGHTLSAVLSTLDNIDLGAEVNSRNPVGKLQQIGKLLQDMRSAVASSEQESKKSRRAAELLVVELNEVQERNDSLLEELSKSSYELQQLYRQKDAAEAGKMEALSHLEQLSMERSEERSKQYSEIMALRTSMNKLRNMLSDINNLLANVLAKELGFLHALEANLESCAKQTDACLVTWPHFNATSGNLANKESFSPMDSWSDMDLEDISSDSDIIDICGSLVQNLEDFMSDISILKQKVSNHSVSWHEQVNTVSKVLETFVKSAGKGKDSEIASLHKKVALLHGACANIFVEVENKKAELVGNKDLNLHLVQASVTDSGIPFGDEGGVSSTRSMVERLSLALKDFVTVSTEMVERNKKELKTAIADLQRDLQEKDIQKDRICTDLVDQIKEAEATARNYAADLQSISVRMHDLEKQLELVERERNSLEERVKELQDGQASSADLQEKFGSLSNLLAAKEQEIEALMQALDEEEVQMEDLTKRIEELEQEVLQKNLDLQNAEASRGKIAKKLSVTVSKFDELHHLSENLLAEVEKLHQQLQDKDDEISFLRQEVTRCTNEVLTASQMNNKRDSDEMQGILSWFDMIVSLVGLQDLHPYDKSGQIQLYMGALEKKILSMISELDDLRSVSQSKDALLEAERCEVAELRQREETLEKILHEKESQVDITTGSTSEIVEVEPVINKWTVSGTSIPSQVRSLRKGNNDQVAIAIDADQADNGSSLEEDDDKAHGFKSLSSSRIIPRFTRPVTDMIDGLWVSCDRTLMRQPALRLSIMMYWAIVHALIAAFVV